MTGTEPRSAGRSLTRTIAALVPANVLVQVLSLGSSVALATQLGAGTETDAYYLALSVPALVYGICLVAVQSGGIPVLTNATHGEGRDALARGCSEIISVTLVAATVFSLAVTSVMVFVLPAAAGGSAELDHLTRIYMVELIPFAVSGALLGALGAMLAVEGLFVVTTLVLAFEPILKSVLVLLFHAQLGAETLVIGNVVGNLLAVAALWGILQRRGVAVRLVRFHSSPIVKSLLKLSAPLMVSSSVLQLNPLVDRATAGSLGAGSITVFELGVRFFVAITSLLTSSTIAPLTATWSARYASGGCGCSDQQLSASRDSDCAACASGDGFRLRRPT